MLVVFALKWMLRVLKKIIYSTLKMKLTITQLRLNLSEGRLHVLVGGFVIRFQVVVTFIKRCELLELKTRMRHMNQHEMVNYHNVSSHNVLLWDIVTTVTKSDKVLVTCANITMTALKLREWN